MPEAPRITAAEAINAFEKVGFVVVRKRGSHRILTKDGHRYTLSIPDHGRKCIGVGLLNSQIEAAGLTREEFIALLD